MQPGLDRKPYSQIVSPDHLSEYGGGGSDNQNSDNGPQPLPINPGTDEVGINGIAPGLNDPPVIHEHNDLEGNEVEANGVAPGLRPKKQKTMGVR